MPNHRGTDWLRTFIRIPKSSSEGASHFDISILEVLEEQLLHGDGLAVHLERLALVAGHRPRQHQDFLEEEDVELLQGKTSQCSHSVLRELTHPVGFKATFICSFTHSDLQSLLGDNAKVWHTAGLHQQLYYYFTDP